MPLAAPYAIPQRMESPAGESIQAVANVDHWTVRTKNGAFHQTYRLDGIPPDTAHDDEIANWHEQLARFIKNVGTPTVQFCSHIDHFETAEYPAAHFPPGYARAFNERYRALIMTGSRKMFVNQLYLSILFQPRADAIGKIISQADLKLNPGLQDSLDAAAMEYLNNLHREIDGWLGRWGPHRLGAYLREVGDLKKKMWYSRVNEWLGYLINGYWQPMPYLRANLQDTLCTARPIFGREVIEFRAPERSTYGAILSWKDPPAPVYPGQLNTLLRAGFSHLTTQTYAGMDMHAAAGSLRRQGGRLTNSGDDARTAAADLVDALEGLAENRFTMGDHHLSVLVKADSVRALNSHVAEARSALAAGGGVVAREAGLVGGLEPAYWAQQPGAMNMRPRPNPVTSRNYAALISGHNYSGNRLSAHWGGPLAILKTPSGMPYYLHIHRNDVGHFAIYGSVGAGKTVLEMFILLMLQQFEPWISVFDVGQGCRLCILAMGGQYFDFKPGQYTDIQPFQLDPTDVNIEHVQELVRVLLRDEKHPYTASENNQIDRGAAAVFDLPVGMRRLGQLMHFLDPPRDNNLAARLLRWVHHDSGVGPSAWVFDNEHDRLSLTTTRTVGFDTTHFLDRPEIRTPLVFHLTHRTEQLKNGQKRGGTLLGEAWRQLDDPMFVPLLKNWLKLDRKKDWFLGLETQSPSDTIKSAIAATVREQVHTKFALANIEATYEDYVDGLGFTRGEFEAIKGLPDNGRTFLIKQGHNASLVELDLSQLPDDVAIMSSKPQTIALLEKIRHEIACPGGNPYGDPRLWERFHAERERA